MVEIFGLSLKKPVEHAFKLGFFDEKFHANTALVGITLHFLERATSVEVQATTNGKHIANPAGDDKVVELCIDLSY